MSNNLKIMGKTYNGVSSITAHDATSGTHTYYDTSTVNATASDVKSGKKIINSSGTEVTGTLANYYGDISLSPTETISSLANTTWLFKYNLDFSTSYQWSINFISNNNTYTGLACVVSFQELWYYSTGSSTLYLEGGWSVYPQYQKIKIIDGTDISSSTLINWLNANAILIKDEDSNVTVRYGNAALGELTEDSTLTLSTNGKISTNNITITYTKPSGGGGSGASVNLYQFHFSGFGIDFGDVYSTEDLDDYNLLPSDFAPANGKYIFAWVDGLPSTGTNIHYADSNYDDEYDITGIICKISSFNGANYYNQGGGKYDDQFDIPCSFFARDSMYNYVVSGDCYFGLYIPGRSNNKITTASGNLVDMVNNRDMYYTGATVNYTLNIMIVNTN